MLHVVDPARIHTRADFAEGLTALREAAGLTVRELARAVDRPPGTVGDYLSGRHVPGPAQQGVVVDILAACDVTDPGTVDEWLAALRRARASSDRRTNRTAAPYRGLAAFEPEDAALFFGRDAQTADILRRVAGLLRDPGPSGGVLAVLGPSGSGKSSLLRAGVVAAVRDGALDDDEAAVHWTCAVTTPAGDPAGALAAALAARGDGPHLVVLDQFEELFTGTDGDGARRGVLADLAGRDPDVVVVLGMRADFFSAAAREPLLLAVLQHAQVVVGPLGEAELRAAIEGPPVRMGASVDPALADVVLADLAPRDTGVGAHDPGALPLLSHALLVTWEHSNGKKITVEDYRGTGGLGAAVQRTAEDVYTGLDPDAQQVAHDLFVRLVNVEGDIALTRRRISRDEVGLDDDDTTTLREVVDRFVDRRLLTVTGSTVEVSHEALLTAWPRLRGWLDADRAGHAVHRRITTAANAWQDADHEPSTLLAGTPLAVAEEWAAAPSHHRRMNAAEQDFLAASVHRRDAAARAERVRTRRLVQLSAALGVLLLLAGVLTVYALSAERRSDRARAAATRARDDALARQVSFQARQLDASDPALAEQLALVAYRIAPDAVAQAALAEESAHPLITRVLGPLGPTSLALGPARGLIAVGHADGTVHLFARRVDAAPAPLSVLPASGPDQQVFTLAFGPDERLLAAAGQTKTVTLWDVADTVHPTRLAELDPGFTGDIEGVALSADGHTAFVAGKGPTPLERWDVTDPAHPHRLAPPVGVPAVIVNSLSLAPNGALAAATDAGSALVWGPGGSGTPRVLASGATNTLTVGFVPSAHLLLVGVRDGTVQVWSDTPRPRRLRTVTAPTNALPNTLAVRADGGAVAVGYSDGALRTYALPDWTVTSTVGNPGPVTGTVFDATTHQILTTTADGTLRLQASDRGIIPVRGTAFAMQYAGPSIVLVGDNGAPSGAQLWDVADPAAPRPLTPVLQLPTAPTASDGTGAVRHDGDLVAVGGRSGLIGLWDTTDKAHPRLLGTPFAAAGALVESVMFSPDGRLLAVASDDGTDALWDVSTPSTPHLVARLAATGELFVTAFSPDGRLLAAGSSDNSVYVWNLADAAHPRRVARLTGFRSYVYGVTFSPDSRLLAASSADHTARLWNVSSSEGAFTFRGSLIGPTGYALSDAFSPDGHDLAIGSDDDTVRIYDVRSSAQVPRETLTAFPGSVWSLAYAPAGRTLAAGGRATSITFWSTDYASFAKRACAMAGDPITRAEWALYVPGAAYDPPCVSRR